MLITNGAIVKGGSLYPITVKKQLQAQDQEPPCVPR